MKKKLKKVLKDNERELAVMDEEATFYKECQELTEQVFKKEEARGRQTSDDEQLIPLIYFDKKANKTIVKLEASKRDKRKLTLI